jgi:predicted enzyme related to lactoylglutathione lyase
MDPVVHFEMPYEDRQRMADFYSKAFGWKAQLFGPEMGDYATVQTGPTDEKGNRPTEPGYINGGLFKRVDAKSVPSIVISVKDIHASMKKAADAGAEVLGGQKGPGEPDDIPGVGLYASFIDTEGNRIGMLQAK